MAYNWASWAVIVVIIRCVCHEVEIRVHMLQVEQRASIYGVTLFLSFSEFGIIIAFNNPIISAITETIISIACNFLSIRYWRFETSMRMQIFASHIVLESYFITTLDWLSSSAHFAIDEESIAFFDRPDTIIAVCCGNCSDNLLTTARTEIKFLAVYTIAKRKTCQMLRTTY